MIMKQISTAFRVLFLICALNKVYGETIREKYSNKWLVELKNDLPENQVDLMAGNIGFVNRGKIFYDDVKYEFENSFLSSSSNYPEIQAQQALINDPMIKYAEQQKLIKVSTASVPYLEFNDVNYDEAYYLREDDSSGHSATTLNVQKVWRKGYTGEGVVVTVIDTGLEWDHPDIINNYDENASYDFVNRDSDPTPGVYYRGYHGTACAGIIAARANNTVCTVGIAFKVNIGGIRLFDDKFGPGDDITDIDIARSLSFNQNHIDVYSNSWEPLMNFRKASSAVLEAIYKGITKGRGGKGNIYIFAGGNYNSVSAARSRAAGTSGYKNLRHSMVINSVSPQNRRVSYARQGACVMLSAYGDEVTTLDTNGQCKDSFTGTSSATPMAAALVALMLQANSSLTWRDVHHISILAANSTIIQDSEPFMKNAAGLNYSVWFGFGLMDGQKMVDLAENWMGVPAMRWIHSGQRVVDRDISLEGLFEDEISVGPKSSEECAKSSSRVPCYIEQVILTVNIDAENRGYTEIKLTSPSDLTVTVLPETRIQESSSLHSGFYDWDFLIVSFWGETLWGNHNATWKLTFRQSSSSYEVTVESYSLLIFGSHEHPYGGRSHLDLIDSVTPGVNTPPVESTSVRSTTEISDSISTTPNSTAVSNSSMVTMTTMGTEDLINSTEENNNLTMTSESPLNVTMATNKLLINDTITVTTPTKTTVKASMTTEIFLVTNSSMTTQHYVENSTTTVPFDVNNCTEILTRHARSLQIQEDNVEEDIWGVQKEFIAASALTGAVLLMIIMACGVMNVRLSRKLKDANMKLKGTAVSSS